MKNIARWSPALALLLAAVLSIVLVATEPGLRLAFRIAQAWIPGEVDVEALHGRIAGPIEITGLHYRNDDAEVRIGNTLFDWRPLTLLSGRLAVSELRVNDIEIRLAPAAADDRPRDEPTDGDFAFSLPIRISVDRLDVRNANLLMPDREPLTLDRLSLRAGMSDDELLVDALQLEAMGFIIDAAGSLPLSAKGPLHIRARFDGEANDITWRGGTTLSGTAAAIEAELTLDKPISAHGTASVEPLAGPPRWQASVGVEPFMLTDVLADARPVHVLAAEIEGQGEGTLLEASGQIAVSDAGYGAWNVDFDGRADEDRRELRRVVITASGGDARITGRAAHLADDDSFDIDFEWQQLSWPPVGAAQVRSPRGAAAVSGSLDDYRFSSTGRWLAADLPPADLSIHGEGNRDGVDIREMSGDFLDGKWIGAGHVGWQPALRWSFSLSADDVDPASFHAAAGGRLDGRMRMDGSFDETLALAIDIDSLSGEFRDHPFDARARIAVKDGVTAIDDLRLRSGDIELKGRARLDDQWDIAWRLDAGGFEAILPGLGGSARSQGTLSGPPDALRAKFTLDAEGLSWDDHGVDRLDLNADISLGESGEWRAALAADGVHATGHELGRVTFDLDGVASDHDAVLRIEHTHHLYEQHLAGAFRDDRWQARLYQGRLEQADIGAWSQTPDAELLLALDEAGLDAYCLRQDAAEACIDASLAAGMVSARLDWRGFDLSRLDPWLPNPRAGLGGETRGVIELQSMDGGIGPLRMEVRGDPGELRYPLPPRGEMHALEFESITLDAVADDEHGLRGALKLVLNDRERLDVNLSLPAWRAAAPAPGADDPLQGRIDLELRDLTVLALMLPEWQAGDGAFIAGIGFDGSVGEPRIEGMISAQLDHLVFTRFGVRLDEINIDTQIRDSEWTLAGGARLDQGRFELAGNGVARSATDWSGDISLHGDDLQLLRIPTAEITASPALTLHIDPRELAFDGTLRIPRARIEPVVPESTVKTSEDIVIVGAPEPDQLPAPFDVHGRMELILGDQVRLIGMGFEGRLTGRLLLMVERDGSLNGQGEIRVADGRYRAYGQNLSITQGRVLYAGGPLDNPAIDIIASRMRGNIEVGVRVTGTAEQPQIALFSNPAMDDADVLSYLILGRPMDQAREGDGQLLHQAATSAALVGGEALAERISDRFGIAEVSIETGDDTAETALVLGRALSQRLYVRYIQGLFENTSAVQLRYQLSDKWTVETESGTRAGAGADILYTLER